MSKSQNIFLAAVIIAVFAIALVAMSVNPTAVTPVATEATEAPTEAPTEPPLEVDLALSEYRVLLNWEAVEGAESYRISCDNGSGMTELGTADTNTFRMKGLKSGTAYTFSIQGVRQQDGGEFLVGDALTVRGCTQPNAPVVKAKRSGDTCTLSWDAIARADEYTIESSTDGKTWYTEGTTTETKFTFTADGSVIYVAVYAVKHNPSGDVLSDYTKICLTARKASGKMISFGDSIAVGSGAHNYSYADIFAQKNNLTLVDKADPDGALSADNAKKQHIAEAVRKEADNSYDYVFIEGGNNDHVYNSPLGEVTSDYYYDGFDLKTTCGALEDALSYLQENCPDTQVVFILIHRHADYKNRLGLTFKDYAKAIREVCAKYDVPVADVYKNSDFDATDPEMCSQYTFHFNEVYPEGDGLRPNEDAYNEFYLPLIEKALGAE